MPDGNQIKIPRDGHSNPRSYKQAASYLTDCVWSSQNKDGKEQLPDQKRLQIKWINGYINPNMVELRTKYTS